MTLAVQPRHAIPADLADVTPDFLTDVVQTVHPGAIVSDFELLEVKRYGEIMVSTSDRLKMRLVYKPGTADGLPDHVAVKMKRSSDAVLGELYGNEVDCYVRLRPDRIVEAPAVVGGVCDRETALYYLLLEDLSLRGAVFPSALRGNTVDEVKAVLDQFAKLHAAFWNSPRLQGDLSWYQVHTKGPLAERMDQTLPQTISANVEAHVFKQEILAGLGTGVPELHRGYRMLQRHQQTLPQTILHGDGHIGNTYLLPDGSAGLLDWQLTSRGAWAHDVNYLILTALDIETRRREERSLIGHYLDGLRANGVTDPPSDEQAWADYRRGILWSLYVGWLTTPVTNYGEALNVENLTRTSTAFADHDTKQMVANLDT